MVKVEYSSNNSGGGWWLKDEDWYALEDAGWDVEWVEKDPWTGTRQNRWLGALAREASKEVDRPEDAVEEFERITGQDASEIGCTCCGQPHEFMYTDEEGKRHYGTAIVKHTEMEWN